MKLYTIASGPDWAEETAAILNITEALKDRLNELRLTALSLKKGTIGKSFYSIEVFDQSIDVIYTQHYPGLDSGEDPGEEYDNAMNDWVPLSDAWSWNKDVEAPRIQCSMMVVTDDSVRWTFYEKHSEEIRETTELYWKDIDPTWSSV